MVERGAEIETYMKYLSVLMLGLSILMLINYAVVNYITGYVPLPYIYGFLALAAVIAYTIVLVLMEEFRNAAVTLLIPLIWTTLEYVLNPLEASAPTYYSWILITVVALLLIAELEKRLGSEEEIERRLSSLFVIVFYVTALIVVLASYKIGTEYNAISMFLLLLASIVGLAMILTKENKGLMISLLAFLAFTILVAIPKSLDVSDACLRSSYLAVAISFTKAWFSTAS